jgi:hypothetical protein
MICTRPAEGITINHSLGDGKLRHCRLKFALDSSLSKILCSMFEICSTSRWRCQGIIILAPISASHHLGPVSTSAEPLPRPAIFDRPHAHLTSSARHNEPGLTAYYETQTFTFPSASSSLLHFLYNTPFLALRILLHFKPTVT